jgi:hypothetical protein
MQRELLHEGIAEFGIIVHNQNRPGISHEFRPPTGSPLPPVLREVEHSWVKEQEFPDA